MVRGGGGKNINGYLFYFLRNEFVVCKFQKYKELRFCMLC